MAGEVEESFSINVQADSIHSGSISFGRFETEPLCWERRSSFSHNKYLEEVEKCSKPGSVIEKKAYFEAHFKKKGLFGIIPSAGHDRSDRATSENDSSERISNQEDFESNDGHYAQFDQRSQDDFEPDERDYYVQIEQRSQEDFEPNEDGCYVHIGDIPVSSDSDYHGEFGVIGYGREDASTECPILSFSSPQMEFATNSSNDLEDATNKSITLDEAHQFENERSNNDEAITEVKRDDDDTVNTDESSRKMSMAVNEPAQDAEKTILYDPSNPSPKLEPGLNSEVNNVGVRKSTSSKSPKDPARRTNMEKNLSKLATPTTRSACRTAKEVRIHESESKRLNRAFSSTKSDAIPRAAGFNFKSSERAERRKEFYLKMEEKMHAKEAEMNQVQAISQEKKEADIKKLRKSLNFKATPMPSFYRTTLPSQSHGNKAVSNNTRSKRVQNKPKCPGSGSEASSSLKLKMGNDQAANESVAATEPRSISIDKSTETNASEASSTISSVTNNHTSEKKGRAKVTLQKRGVSESCKGAKLQSNEGNKNGETSKQRNETMRKGVRNVGLRSSSRNGNLAVRVAS